MNFTSVNPSGDIEPRKEHWTQNVHAPSSGEEDSAVVDPFQANTDVVVPLSNKCNGHLQTFLRLITEYANNSSIHGVRYMGERRRPWIERLYWVISFCISMYLCSGLILKVWIKWEQSPVIVSLIEKTTPIWTIPFPSITICSQSKAKSTIFNFTEIYNNGHNLPEETLTTEQIKNYQAISHTCKNEFDSMYSPWLRSFNKTFDTDVVTTLTDLNPELDDRLLKCQIGNIPYGFHGLFRRTLTERGVCYNFNLLPDDDRFRMENMHTDYNYTDQHFKSVNWTAEKGYSADDTLYVYPLRTNIVGSVSKLICQLPIVDPDFFDDKCQGTGPGFTVSIHSPDEYPRVSKQYISLPLSQKLVVAVKPTMTTTSAGLREYSPIKRQCYFSDERDLQFFKDYTQKNCELECLTNFTMDQCGCVKFSMPRNASTPVCGYNQINCYNAAEQKKYWKLYYEFKAPPCGCLPSCNSITYDTETLLEKLDYKYKLSGLGRESATKKIKGAKLARLEVFFKETEEKITTSHREVMYDKTDILAYCGGILGLCMGVSILSIVEIIYHFTIRLCCNFVMRKRS